MYLNFVNPFYRYDGYTGDRIELISEGDLIATAYSCLNTGRYTLTDPTEMTAGTLLYRDWQLALSEGSGLPVTEIEHLDRQESYE